MTLAALRCPSCEAIQLSARRLADHLVTEHLLSPLIAERRVRACEQDPYFRLSAARGAPGGTATAEPRRGPRPPDDAERAALLVAAHAALAKGRRWAAAIQAYRLVLMEVALIAADGNGAAAAASLDVSSKLVSMLRCAPGSCAPPGHTGRRKRADAAERGKDD